MNGDYYNVAVGSEYGSAAMEYSVDPAAGAIAAIMGGVLLIMMLFGLVIYIYIAVSLMKIAKKTGTSNAWFAWIPILNVILMLQIANKPIWWLFLFFIPVINIVFTILVWMEIAKRVGKPEWWGILIIIPLVNLVVPGYLAFSDDEKDPTEQADLPEKPQQNENDNENKDEAMN